MLLVAAVVGYLQLRRYTGPLSADLSGALQVDPVLVVAPAVVLLAGAVLATRSGPLLAVAAERLGARAVGSTLPLAGWQVGRRLDRATGPVLLVVLAIATGVTTAGYTATLDRSQQDQATFQVGTDVWVTPAPLALTEQPLTVQRKLSQLPGVEATTPGVRQPLLVGNDFGTALLLDGRRAGAVMLARPDLADEPLEDLLARTAAARPTLPGLALPAGARQVTVTLSATRLDPQLPKAQLTVYLVLRDASGEVLRLPAGALPLDGRPHRLDVAVPGVPAGQLDLLAVDVEYPSPNSLRWPFGLALVAVESDGTPLAAPTGRRWRAQLPPADSGSVLAEVADRTVPGTLVSATVTSSGDQIGADTARVLLGVDDLVGWIPPQVPAVVSPSLLSQAAATSEGDASTGVTAHLGSLYLTLQPVGVLREVPTLAGGERGAVLDLPTVALLSWLSTGESTVAAEWWLRAADPPAVAARLRADGGVVQTVADRVALAQTLRDDPLTAGVVGALGIVLVAAAAVAAIGFTASATVAARQRMAEFAVLQAVGLSGRQLLVLVLTEQGVLVGLGVVLGVALGLLVTSLVVPLVILTADAARPVPAVLMVAPWAALLGLAAALAAVLGAVVVALGARLRRVDAAALLRQGGDR